MALAKVRYLAARIAYAFKDIASGAIDLFAQMPDMLKGYALIILGGLGALAALLCALAIGALLLPSLSTRAYQAACLSMRCEGAVFHAVDASRAKELGWIDHTRKSSDRTYAQLIGSAIEEAEERMDSRILVSSTTRASVIAMAKRSHSGHAQEEADIAETVAWAKLVRSGLSISEADARIAASPETRLRRSQAEAMAAIASAFESAETLRASPEQIASAFSPAAMSGHFFSPRNESSLFYKRIRSHLIEAAYGASLAILALIALTFAIARGAKRAFAQSMDIHRDELRSHFEISELEAQTSKPEARSKSKRL